MTAQATTWDTAPSRPLWQMRSVRQFAWSVLLWGGFVGVFYVVAQIEPSGGWLAHRKAPAQVVQGGPIRTAMLFTGMAHFLIAFLFQWTSSANATPRARRNMGLGAVGGILICLLFLVAGGGARYTASYFLLAAFFVVHALRDENVFGKRFGDIPARRLGPSVYLPLLGALSCVALTVAWSFFFVFPEDSGRKWMAFAVDPSAVTGTTRLLWWWLPAGSLLALTVGLLAYARRTAGGPLLRMAWDYRGLLLVYIGIGAVCLLGWATEGGFYAIVLLHVTTWWVFTTVEMRKHGVRGGPRELGLFGWMRRTQVGFQTLHIGLTVLTLAFALLWIHGTGQSNSHLLRGVASQEAFRYWTILHISLSFVPRPA